MTAATYQTFGDGLNQSIPLQRGGTPADISGKSIRIIKVSFVGAAIYLSSRAGQWITGTILVLDGGTTSKSNL